MQDDVFMATIANITFPINVDDRYDRISANLLFYADHSPPYSSIKSAYYIKGT
jgi:hypothetical protein